MSLLTFGPHEVGEGPDPTPVYGGQPVADCGFPTTLHAGSCTATLVHPQVAILAAHCYDPVDVFLGQWRQDREDPELGRVVGVDHCEGHPDYEGSQNLGDGVDIKYCVLAEPVEDVPIVPILMGCETDVLVPGKDVTIVGFGIQDLGMTGAKVEVTTPINAITATQEVDIGGDGKDSCNGDSGGPVYVRLTEDDGFDDTWRVFGVTSYGKAIGINSCGMGGYYTQMSVHVPWIEERSGFDITPCHDADGTWNAGPGCGGFPLRADAPAGQWNQCDWSGDAGGGSGQTCGPPYDVTAPFVSITEPADGTRLEVADSGDTVGVAVRLEVDDGEGSGVEQVELRVETDDGSLVWSEMMISAPFVPEDVDLSAGSYRLLAHAIDANGNQGESTAVAVAVAVVEMPDPDPDDGAGEETDEGGESSGTSGEDGGAEDASHGGCGCNGSVGRQAWLWPLLLLVAGRRRPCG